jgi:hypothetical protein
VHADSFCHLLAAAVLDVFMRRAVVVPGDLEAVAEKRQQLFGRPETQFPPRVDLLDETVEMALRWLRVRPQPEYERPSHHISPYDGSRLERVKVPLNCRESSAGEPGHASRLKVLQ